MNSKLRRGKKARIVKALATITTTVGLLIILGSVGGSDTGLIGLRQAILQIIIGLVLTIGGAIYGVYLQEKFK